jgi:endo-1,4-beta-D-glucanase Y
MRRRVFIQSGSAALALALAGCGGGGGGSAETAAGDGTGTGATATGPVAGIPQTSPAGHADGAYPFGSRQVPYTAGILPNSVSTAQMDSTIKSAYDAWKARSIVDVPTVPGGKAIKFGSSDSFLTVSEGAGYGMLITVVMAGHDPGARAAFDGLLTTVRARPAKGMMQYFGEPAKYLMDWRLKLDGTSSDWNDKGANAMDGDLDIALALLMAHRQWGSGGGWNYREEAINTINALKLVNMKENGATKGLPSGDNNRTSDYMIGHFRAFKKATGDALWDRAVDKAYELINRMQTVFSPNAGLMPDFVINTHADAEPSRGYIGDGTPTEGFFYANALRNPWRFGSDFVLSGDTRWRDVNNKLVNFIKADCGGDPERIALGYRLDGTATERSYAPKATIACMIGGALVDASHQQFLNRLWDWTASHLSRDYYDSELQLLPMMVASGNWWTP